jgi:hypothetical protein
MPITFCVAVTLVAVNVSVLELNFNPPFVFGPKSPVAAVKKQGKHSVSTASTATVIAVGVPALAEAQVQTPLPLVVKTCPASPSAAGKVIVQVPATSATFRVTTPLVVPLNIIDPVVPEAAPSVKLDKEAKAVAPNNPEFELKVSPALVLGPRSPVAAVANKGKQVVSVASLATVILVIPETVAETSILLVAAATFIFLNSGVAALVTPIKQCF